MIHRSYLLAFFSSHLKKCLFPPLIRMVRIRGIIVDQRGLPFGYPVAPNRIIANCLLAGKIESCGRRGKGRKGWRIKEKEKGRERKRESETDTDRCTEREISRIG